MRNIACVVVLHLAIVTTGCTKTVIKRVARFDVNRDSVAAIAPRTGVYKVKYVSMTSSKGRSAVDSSRVLRQGDRLGFRKTEDGRILAVAGEEEFELHDLPANASRFCWYHRTTEPSQFAKNVAGVVDAATVVGQSAAFAAGAGAIIVGGAVLNGTDDEYDCDPPPRHDHRHHHRH
jgi:hypothetical protein